MSKLVNNESGILSLLVAFGKFKSVRLNASYKSLELAVLISQAITTCLVFKLVILIFIISYLIC